MVRDKGKANHNAAGANSDCAVATIASCNLSVCMRGGLLYWGSSIASGLAAWDC